MKKRNLLFIVVCFCLLTLSLKVNAKEYIHFDWGLIQGGASNYLYYDHTIEDEDGYITASIDDEYNGVLRKVSKDGKKVIWEQKNDTGVYMALDQDNTYIYAVLLPTSEDECLTSYCYYDDSYIPNRYIFKFSKSTGEEVGRKVFSRYDDTVYDVELYVKNDIYVITRSYDNDEHVNKATKLYTISKDLSYVNVQDYDSVSESQKDSLVGGYKTLIDDSIYKYIELPDGFDKSWCDIDGSIVNCYKYKSNKEYYGYVFISNTYKASNSTYAVGEAYFEISEDGDYDNLLFEEYYSFVMKIDNSTGKVEWLKKANNDYMYYDIVGLIDDFVIVVGYEDDNYTYIGEERDSESVVSSLFIYDAKGNLVQEHDLAKEFGVSRVDITHVMPFGNALVGQAFAYDEDGEMSSLVFRYLLTNNIEVKVEGSGNVSIPEDSVSGTVVEFTVTPDAKWKLDKVEVKDKDGNVIEVKDGKFTMPNSDVIVTASFKVENPNTADIAIIGTIVAGIGFGIFGITRYRKLKFLK